MNTDLNSILGKARSAKAKGFPFAEHEIIEMTSSVHASPAETLAVANSSVLKIVLLCLGVAAIVSSVFLFVGNQTPNQTEAQYDHSVELSISSAAIPSRHNNANSGSIGPKLLNTGIPTAAPKADSSNEFKTIRAIILNNDNSNCFNTNIYEDSLVIAYEDVYDIACFQPPLNRAFDMSFPKCGIGNFRSSISFCGKPNRSQPHSYTANCGVHFTQIRPLIYYEMTFPLAQDTIIRFRDWLSSPSKRMWIKYSEALKETYFCQSFMLPPIRQLIQSVSSDKSHLPNISEMCFTVPRDSFPIASQLIPVLYLKYKPNAIYAVTIWYMNDSIADQAIGRCVTNHHEKYSFRTLDSIRGLNQPTMQEDPDLKKEHTEIANRFKHSKGTFIFELSASELAELGIEQHRDSVSYPRESFFSLGQATFVHNTMQRNASNRLAADSGEFAHGKRGYGRMYHTNYSLKSAEYYRSDSISFSRLFRRNEFFPDSNAFTEDKLRNGKRVAIPVLVGTNHVYYEYDVFLKEYFLSEDIQLSAITSNFDWNSWHKLNNQGSKDTIKAKNLVGVRVVLGDSTGSYGCRPDYTEVVFWYEADESFAELMPERYRSRLLKELEVQHMIGSGTIPSDSACSILNNEENIFGMCGNHDGALYEMRIAPNPISTAATAHFKLLEPRRLRLGAFTSSGEFATMLSDYAELASGEHSIPFQCDSLPKGVYYIVLLSDKGEMIYVKAMRL